MKFSLQRPRSRLVFWLNSRNPARAWRPFIYPPSVLIPLDTERLRKAGKIDLSRFSRFFKGLIATERWNAEQYMYKMKMITGWKITTFLLLVFGCTFWLAWFFNPLPSDRKLIKNFNDHQSEFEFLVQGYRNHRDKSVFYQFSSPKVLKIMKEIGVDEIAGAGGNSGMPWYPEPYSEHTLQVRKSLEIRSIKDPRTEEGIMNTLHRELPKLFENVTLVRDLIDLERKSNAVDFSMGSDPNNVDLGVRVPRYLNTFIEKRYRYYPQTPKVEDGHIINAGYSLRDKAYSRSGERVFRSLDRFPPDWKRGECVLRRIDAHWFLTMCRAWN